ncbi:MAG: YaaA family protein [Oscillospiraceae bacterium]|jgi:cytoplasmic iron level regulating protein YaaA (DUF328/UPF0246 family)|nr:YaaA family protein [Oscillospiraceae bacterium]
MLFIMSPARNSRPVTRRGVAPHKPLFIKEATRLAEILRGYSSWELESLLALNPERALDMSACYSLFDPEAPGSPALYSYYGAAYRNMNPDDFTAADFNFAQERLCILSALYGFLRPADGILPHRLGMGREFKIDGQDLYAFWGDKIHRALYADAGRVLNLASTEYAKLVTPHMRSGEEMVSCRFLIQKPDGARGTVSTVRAARGQMARYIIKNRVTRVEDIKAFDWSGYQFIPGRSDVLNYVFIQNPRQSL